MPEINGCSVFAMDIWLHCEGGVNPYLMVTTHLNKRTDNTMHETQVIPNLNAKSAANSWLQIVCYMETVLYTLHTNCFSGRLFWSPGRLEEVPDIHVCLETMQ